MAVVIFGSFILVEISHNEDKIDDNRLVEKLNHQEMGQALEDQTIFLEKSLNTTSDELDAILKEKIKELNAQNEEQQDQIANLMSDVADTEANLETKIEELNAQNQAQQQKLTELQSKLAEVSGVAGDIEAMVDLQSPPLNGVLPNKDGDL